jgi:hypothetical protein
MDPNSKDLWPSIFPTSGSIPASNPKTCSWNTGAGPPPGGR